MSSNRNRRLVVWHRDDKTCWICKKIIEWDEMTLDHVIPLSKGGARGLHNCKAAHGSCNTERGNALPPPGMGALRRVRVRKPRPRGPVLHHITNQSVIDERIALQKRDEERIALQKRDEPS